MSNCSCYLTGIKAESVADTNIRTTSLFKASLVKVERYDKEPGIFHNCERRKPPGTIARRYHGLLRILLIRG